VYKRQIFNVLCLPAAPWVTPGWANRYADVPEWAGTPVLVAVTAAMILLCAFRKRIFYGDGGTGDPPEAPPPAA